MPFKTVPGGTELGSRTRECASGTTVDWPAENGCAADVEVAAGWPCGRGSRVVACIETGVECRVLDAENAL